MAIFMSSSSEGLTLATAKRNLLSCFSSIPSSRLTEKDLKQLIALILIQEFIDSCDSKIHFQTKNKLKTFSYF